MQLPAPASRFPAYCLTVLTVYLLFLGGQAQGQVPDTRFINYTTQHGLPHNVIRSIAKDKQGFLWIGTKNGLSRFDGVRFRNFYYNPNDSNSISGNDVVSLFCDSKGFVWISTMMNGLNRYNPFTGRFEKFIHDENDSTSLGGLNPMTVIEDAKGQIWICMFGAGINRFNEKTKTFERFRFEQTPGANYHFDECSRAAFDSKGILWIVTRVGLVKFNTVTKDFEKVIWNLPGGKYSIFTTIYIDPSDNLWLGTFTRGLTKYNPQTGVWNQYLNKPDVTMATQRIWDIKSYKDQQLYIATTGGGFGLFDTISKTFSFFSNEPNNYYSFPGNGNTHCIYKSGQQVFIGSDYGLSIITPAANLFKFYSVYDKTQEDTTLDMISVLIPALRDSTIYFGTYYRNGLYEYHLRRGIIKKYNSPGTDYLEHIYDLLPSITSKDTWLMGTVNGVKSFDIQKKQMADPLHWPSELKELLKNKPLDVLFRSKNNHLWIGARGTLVEFDEVTLQYRDYAQLVQQATGKKLKLVFDIFEDDRGKILVCVASHQIISIDPVNGSIQSGFRGKAGVIKIPGEPRQVVQDSAGNYWIGLYGAGIGMYNAVADQLKIFTRQEGLAGVGFNTMFVNHDGKVWTNSEYGITIIDPVDFSTTNITERNGLLTGQDINMHLQEDGTVFLTTHNAIAFFKPADLYTSTSPPEVELSSFKIFDDEYVTHTSINHMEAIELSYRQNYFTIEFASADFDNPEGITYSYMLEGVDKEWINNGGRNMVSYTNIGGGTYFFKVKARNSEGLWSSNEKVLKIVVIPPFWKTNVFIALAIALGIFLMFILVSLRIRNIRKKEQTKSEYNKRIAELEMTALRAQMNPHFIFNCLNSINRYILKSDRDTAAEYVTKFSRLIRLILDNSRANTVSLSNEIAALKLYLEMETLRFENKFEYLINIAPEFDPDKIMVPPMIFQPYVENAIWHGLMHKDGPGKIEVNFHRDEDFLICTIDDNGVGRKQAAELESKFSVKNKSHGLMVTAKRLTIYNQQENLKDEIAIIDKSDQKGVPCGTTVILKVLIKENQP